MSDVGEEYISWLNDSEVTRYLEVGDATSTRATVKKYLERFQNGVTDHIFAIIDIINYAGSRIVISCINFYIKWIITIQGDYWWGSISGFG